MEIARAFIVRPFGTKDGIDFDRVEKDLIAPALTRLGIEGRTTGEITRQGNIREDMFRLLVALRCRDRRRLDLQRQRLLRARHPARSAGSAYPADPRQGFAGQISFRSADRPIFQYDPAEPADKLAEFLEALRSTLATTDKDSPVFQLLPASSRTIGTR